MGAYHSRAVGIKGVSSISIFHQALEQSILLFVSAQESTFFLTLGNEHNCNVRQFRSNIKVCSLRTTTTVSFTAGTSHTLNNSDGGDCSVVTNDQINFTDIETFFANARGNECVEFTRFKLLQHFLLFTLRHTVTRLIKVRFREK